MDTTDDMLPGFDADTAVRIKRVAEAGTGVAVFDADGTIWADDVGVAFFLWQLENNRLLPERAHWARGLWGRYQRGELAPRDMWAAVTAAQAGLEEKVVKEWAKDFFLHEFSSRVFLPMK